MKTHNLIQGTAEWLAHRACFWNASDAPAMMGVSPYKSRAALLKELATGLGDEASPERQRLFDEGHRAEKLARPLAEEIIGEELYPIVGSDGDLSASFDGLTLMYDVAFEHKSLNDSLRAAIRQQGGNANEFLAPTYRIQMEQQCLVSGAERVLFMATKWDGDTLVEERHCWYTPDLELRAKIVAGWAMFAEELKAYQPAEVVAPVVAEAVEALPAVVVKVAGEIAITANFVAFQAKLQEFLDHHLIREPKTDQDFATLDGQIKAMKGAEAALDAAEGQMLAQIASVDSAKRTKDMLHKLVRDNRLMAEKLLASEKDRRRAEIVAEGSAKLREHIASLSKRLGLTMPLIAADIAGAIKGKKSLASMEDAIGAELARAKIEANRVADLIDGNRKSLEAADAGHLFPDFAQVCNKASEDFANLITSRRAAAQARLDAERERIRAEEAARLEREQREAQARSEAQARAEQQAADAAARQAEEERQRVEAQRKRDAAHAAALSEKPVADASARAFVESISTPAPAPEVRAFHVLAAGEAPTLSLGDIKARIAPLSIDAAGLELLGFPAKKVKASCMYRASDWPEMLAAMVKTLTEADLQKAAA